MHEVAIAEEIRDIVLKKLDKHKAKKVCGIKLVIGELTTIVPDALLFALEVVSEKTPMKGAKIHIKTIKTKAKCAKCKKEFEVADFNYTCPKCRNQDVKVTAGREMIIQTIEME